MGDIAKGVVGYGLSRARLAPAIKTILGSAINGGINAPFSGMHIGEGFMRGQVYGLTSLGIGCMEIRSELAQDAMQGVAGATVFSTTVPTVGYLTKNGMAATAFGEVSRKANMPVSASVSTDDKLNVILSA